MLFSLAEIGKCCCMAILVGAWHLVTWLHSLNHESPYFTVHVIAAVQFQASAYDVVVRQVDERDLKITRLSSAS